MKRDEIKVGGMYRAKVGVNVTTVRVDAIREVDGTSYRKGYTAYDVTNMVTRRTTTFRSAAKFRGPVHDNSGNEREAAEAGIQPGYRVEFIGPLYSSCPDLLIGAVGVVKVIGGTSTRPGGEKIVLVMVEFDSRDEPTVLGLPRIRPLNGGEPTGEIITPVKLAMRA